jgi:hypothetical protein
MHDRVRSRNRFRTNILFGLVPLFLTLAAVWILWHSLEKISGSVGQSGPFDAGRDSRHLSAGGRIPPLVRARPFSPGVELRNAYDADAENLPRSSWGVLDSRLRINCGRK